jgi:hypothetical protein
MHPPHVKPDREGGLSSIICCPNGSSASGYSRSATCMIYSRLAIMMTFRLFVISASVQSKKL